MNQLLVEMDGFSKARTRPVIVLAATNRPDKLDPALLRRFSRTVDMETADTVGAREMYLRSRLEAKDKHEVSSQMVQRLAAQSPGMSVADLERILAHAAVMSLSNRGVINDCILAEAFERVTLGEAKTQEATHCELRVTKPGTPSPCAQPAAHRCTSRSWGGETLAGMPRRKT